MSSPSVNNNLQKHKDPDYSKYDRQKYLANRTEILASMRKQRVPRSRTVRSLLTEKEMTMIADEAAKMQSVVECVEASKILVALRNATPGLVEAQNIDTLCMQLSSVNNLCDCSEWCRAVGGQSKEN